MSRTRHFSRRFLGPVALVALVALTVTLGASTVAFALNQARLYGTVTDENKKPLAGVKLTVTCPEVSTFRLEAETNAKGDWAVTLIDATKSYNYKFEKPGYQTMQQDFKVALGANDRKDFQMISDAEAIKRGSAVAVQREPTPEEKAVLVFNEAAEAFQMGDMETARKKMAEAAELDPKLTVAHSALAGMLNAAKDYAGAAAAAEKALALDPNDARALRVAVEANTKLGNTAKAKEASSALSAVDPKAAALDLYNQGVREYNAGAMPAAIKLFEQALAADPSYPKNHYMLGMCYIGQGENAKAKKHLEDFLAMAAADDADAGTAKEMLSYLK